MSDQPSRRNDEELPLIDAQIEADDDAQIEDSGHQIERPPGPVRTRTRAGKGAKIIGSGITIIGAPAQAPAPQPRPDAVSLEIAVSRDGAGYRAEARFGRPDSQADVSVAPQPLALDLAVLRSRWPDVRAYGEDLSAALFGATGLRDGLLQALAAAQALRTPLQLLLRLDPAAAELHGIFWETLRHPVSGAPLLTSQQIWFARSLGSSDWTPVDLPAPTMLRALGLVAAPSDLARYRLPPIDGPTEVALAHQALRGFDTGVLGPGAATISNLGTALRAGCDLLYLVAHGAMVDGVPRLWLEREDGTAAVVDGADLAQRIGELALRPLLVVLVSCQSAGRGVEDVAAALGPCLVAAGVPAVLAMQGQIAMATAATFTPALFAALRKDGRIDRAVTEARAAVRDRHDWWMPVLFTRLREGRIWQ